MTKKNTTTYTLSISNMSCQHCISNIEKVALTINGVENITIDLDKATATVTGGHSSEVIQAISNAGYPSQLHTKDSCNISTESLPTHNTSPNDSHAYAIVVSNMTCASCVSNIEKAISVVAGVTSVETNLIEKKVWVVGGDKQQVVNTIIEHGYNATLYTNHASNSQLTLSFKAITLKTKQTQQRLSNILKTIGNNFQYQEETLSFNCQTSPAECLYLLKQQGFEATIQEQISNTYQQQQKNTAQQIRLTWVKAMAAGLTGAFIMVGDMTGIFPTLNETNGQAFWVIMAIITLGVMAFSGKNYYLSAIKQLKHLSSNMDTLVALGTSAAWVSSLILTVKPELVAQAGQYLYLDASVMILAFLQLGHALETRAKQITSNAIGKLIELAPQNAQVLWHNSIFSVPTSLLQPNDIIQVKPGENIPVDGQIIKGHSSINESMMSGEATPQAKRCEDMVMAGTSNLSGLIDIKVTHSGDNTTLAHIIKMVKQAQISKPPIANLVDKISSIFVPTVVIISILTFFSWFMLGPPPQASFALTTAIAVLVIACPCALGLATPIAIMMGTGRAAQLGILIKNSNALQSAALTSHLVIDKTGTLTNGHPTFTNLHNYSDETNDRLLTIASSIESASEHPIGLAITNYATQQKLESLAISDFCNHSGQGVSAIINQQQYYIGNSDWLKNLGHTFTHAQINLEKQHAKQAETPLWLANKSSILALFIVKDPIRTDSFSAIKQLQARGIQVVMCSGDNNDTALAVAKQLGISQVHSQVLPEQKLEIISKLQQQQGHHVAMAGDGINDAPALAKANTGFAIGSGSDIAIDQADITLASNSIHGIVTAIDLSKATLQNIKQNLLGAFLYNVIGIPLAAGVFYPITGWLLHPMFASFAMAMSSVTVVTNANRLRFFTPKEEQNMSKTTLLRIENMSCMHCVNNTKTALETVDGVESVEVILEPGSATITGSAHPNDLIAAIKEAGYNATEQ